MNKIIKIILSFGAIGLLVYVFGLPGGGYAGVFWYTFILPIIWILIRGLQQPEGKEEFLYSQVVNGFLFNTIIASMVIWYFDGIVDLSIFGYVTFFLFIISLAGTQVDRVNKKTKNFFRGSLFSTFVFAIIFGILLII